MNSVLQFDIQFATTPTLISAAAGLTGVSSGTNCAYLECTDTNIGTPQSSTAVPTAAGQVTGYLFALTRSGITYYSVITQHVWTTGSPATQAFYLNPPLPVTPTTNDVISIYPPVRFQRGGAQNLIKRLRVMYGSLVLEDIYEYKTLLRILFEAGVGCDYSGTHGNITDGMFSGVFQDLDSTSVYTETVQEDSGGNTIALAFKNPNPSILSGDQASVLQCAPPVGSAGVAVALTTTPGSSTYYKGRTTLTLNLLSGVLTQKKLIPLKWMAAQLALEITLSAEADCLVSGVASTTTAYKLFNVNFIAEMLEFDSAYDTAFYDGLQSGGVPLKFSSFHYHSFNLSGASNIVQIHERARSVKFGLAVARDTTTNNVTFDSDRFFHDLGASWTASTGLVTNPGTGQILTFQWRVGGRCKYSPYLTFKITLPNQLDVFMEVQKQSLSCKRLLILWVITLPGLRSLPRNGLATIMVMVPHLLWLRHLRT